MRVNKLAVFQKYSLKPDIVTFAKCFGGGMPIGITAFNKKLEKIKKLSSKKFFWWYIFRQSHIKPKLD